MKKILSIVVIGILFISMFLMFAPKTKADSASLTNIVQLTTNSFDDRWAGWSPDGSKIVYSAFADSWYRHIWVMNRDGSSKIQLTFGNVVDESPDYSPDGTKIVFMRYGLRGIEGSDLMLMNADGTNVTQLTSSGLHRGNPRWSPDGGKLTFYYGGAGSNVNEIHLMNIDGTGEIAVASSSYGNMNADWSPDGSKIAYTMDDGIWLVNTSPPYEKTRLYNSSLPTMSLAYSPNGNYILFSSGEYGTPPPQDQDLYLIDTQGSFIAQLTNDHMIGYGLDWSPDGRYIAYNSMSSGNYDLWRATIVGISSARTWTKYANNPVLDLGSSGSWDNLSVWDPSVLLDGTQYKMYFDGNHMGQYIQIGLATSTDGVAWTKSTSNPVLTVGPSGSWDNLQVSDPCVIFDGSGYLMYYSGNDGGRMRIGLATSTDGVVWTKYSGNPILNASGWEGSWVTGPSVIFDGSIYKMWYTGYDGTNQRIGYATSSDGITWTKLGNPVLDIGGAGEWDSVYVSHCTVISDGSSYQMWYGGGSGTGHSRIGHATSVDGISWQKDPSNPVINLGSAGEWDYWSADQPTVVTVGSVLKMWYSGHDGTNVTSSPTYYVRIGLATIAGAQPVIPEVPVGTIVASVSMVLALLGYFALAKLKRKSTD